MSMQRDRGKDRDGVDQVESGASSRPRTPSAGSYASGGSGTATGGGPAWGARGRECSAARAAASTSGCSSDVSSGSDSPPTRTGSLGTQVLTKVNELADKIPLAITQNQEAIQTLTQKITQQAENQASLMTSLATLINSLGAEREARPQ